MNDDWGYRERKHTITVNAWDRAGNEAVSKVITVYKDREAPNLDEVTHAPAVPSTWIDDVTRTVEAVLLLLIPWTATRGGRGYRLGGTKRHNHPQRVLRVQEQDEAGGSVLIRGLTAYVLCCICALAMVLLAPAAASRADSCAPPGSRVLRAEGAARTYELDQGVSACRPGFRLPLGLSPGTDISLGRCQIAVSDVTLRPRYVAWHQYYSCDDQEIFQVFVRRLARGTKTRMFTSGNNACGTTCPDSGLGPVRRIVLRSDGGVAWIAKDASTSDPDVYEVWRADRTRGSKRMLSRSTEISPTFLRWRDDAVVWREAGQERTG